MREPKSAEECIYYTKRNDSQGKMTVWVFKEMCPECGKGLMGKPRDPKTKKVKIRSKEYVCPECGHTVEKVQYEDTLTACCKYECLCGHKDSVKVPFQRRKVRKFDEEKQKKVTVEALVVICGGCGKKLLVTKKMK